MYKRLKLNEALDDEELDIETEETVEDTLDQEENQEENPLEEESELDKELNELREILVDLDLNLYQLISKEDKNNIIYIIGKVAENSDDILMLVDTKPEEINDEEIESEEPLSDTVDNDLTEDDEEDDEEDSVENVDNSVDNLDNEETKNRYDFVILPKSFEEINKLNPRYGEDLTPDHESIVDYLMNCLIELNPEAAEELQNKEDEEESIENLEIAEIPNGEEDLEDE